MLAEEVPWVRRVPVRVVDRIRARDGRIRWVIAAVGDTPLPDTLRLVVTEVDVLRDRSEIQIEAPPATPE